MINFNELFSSNILPFYIESLNFYVSKGTDILYRIRITYKTRFDCKEGHADYLLAQLYSNLSQIKFHKKIVMNLAAEFG